MGSICTAYAFIASVYLLKFITPYSVVLTYNLEPIYGIILALLFFGDSEKMSFQFYIGLFLILFSVLVNMYVKRKFVFSLERDAPSNITFCPKSFVLN